MVMTTIVHDRAGIHVCYYETVHHKEGIIDLAFTDPAHCDKVRDGDTIEILGLDDELTITAPLRVILKHPDGSSEEIPCEVD